FLNITANTALSTNGNIATSQGINYGFLAATVAANNAAFQTTVGGTQGFGAGKGTTDGTIELQVINTGVSIAVQETFVDSATGVVSVSKTLYAPGNAAANGVANAFDNVSVPLGTFTTADVGTTAFIKISQNVAALTNPNNPAFNFQSAAAEGDVIQVGIQATNTSTLRISNINLALSASNAPSL